jgi:hypothetical protein
MNDPKENILLVLFLLLALPSCINKPTGKILREENDTISVMKLALKTAFEGKRLPGIDPLKKGYYHRDSVLFTSDILPLELLPNTIDTLKFKVLTQQQIIESVKTESDLSKLPNYLNVRAFEKKDSGYYVSLQSLSNLNFGGGGQIGIYIEKHSDSFIVRKSLSSSIN